MHTFAVKTAKNTHTVKTKINHTFCFFTPAKTKASTWLGIDKSCYLLVVNARRPALLGPISKLAMGAAVGACYTGLGLA